MADLRNAWFLFRVFLAIEGDVARRLCRAEEVCQGRFWPAAIGTHARSMLAGEGAGEAEPGGSF